MSHARIIQAIRRSPSPVKYMFSSLTLIKSYIQSWETLLRSQHIWRFEGDISKDHLHTGRKWLEFCPPLFCCHQHSEVSTIYLPAIAVFNFRTVKTVSLLCTPSYPGASSFKCPPLSLCHSARYPREPDDRFSHALSDERHIWENGDSEG